MTAALSWPLQQGLFARLVSDEALTSLLGGPKVFDAPPHLDGPEAVRPPYVLLGDETITPWFDKTQGGASHDLVFTAVSSGDGYAEAKAIAGAVSDVLEGAPPALSRGRIVRLQFLGATARRDVGGVRRRVDCRYRVIVEDD